MTNAALPRNPLLRVAAILRPGDDIQNGDDNQNMVEGT